MSGPIVDASRIREHVVRLGERYPPIDLATVDYHVVNPRRVLDRFSHSLEFMARVEMEVERNVLELAIMLPDVSETDRLFYADVWSPQEVHHGIVLDTLGQKLGLPPTEADLTTIVPSVRVLGALSHLPMVHEIIRLLYYLTGAATEKSAILAYNAMSDGLTEMGETAIKKTVIDAIKVQEPGHFAFYRMSALEMVQQKVLAPWQLHLAGLPPFPGVQPGRGVHEEPEGQVRRRAARAGDGDRSRGDRTRRGPDRAPAALGPEGGHAGAQARPPRLPRLRRALPLPRGAADGLSRPELPDPQRARAR